MINRLYGDTEWSVKKSLIWWRLSSLQRSVASPRSSPPEHGAVSFKPDSAPYRRTIGIAASDTNHAQRCTHWSGRASLSVLGPMLHDIDSALTSLSDLQNRPSGTIRITTVEHAAKTILLPAMRTFLKSHPEIDIQLTIDYGLTDVVSERFDAGVRLGGEMDKDMIAIRIGPDIPMAIVGSPDYFSRRSAPTSVSQLIDHQAINLYLPTSGTANRWRLIRGGREVRVRMEGQLLLNTIDLIIDAAIDGHGLAYLPYDQVERAIKEKNWYVFWINSHQIYPVITCTIHTVDMLARHSHYL